jgi:hypothetical protein
MAQLRPVGPLVVSLPALKPPPLPESVLPCATGSQAPELHRVNHPNHHRLLSPHQVSAQTSLLPLYFQVESAPLAVHFAGRRSPSPTPHLATPTYIKDTMRTPSLHRFHFVPNHQPSLLQACRRRAPSPAIVYLYRWPHPSTAPPHAANGNDPLVPSSFFPTAGEHPWPELPGRVSPGELTHRRQPSPRWTALLMVHFLRRPGSPLYPLKNKSHLNIIPAILHRAPLIFINPSLAPSFNLYLKSSPKTLKPYNVLTVTPF